MIEEDRLRPEEGIDVLLRDGSTVRLRPVNPEDEPQVVGFFSRLSQRSLYLRFHHVVPKLSAGDIGRYLGVDGREGFALAATLGEKPNERIIALGQYMRLPDQRSAEVGFLVEDSHQGRGIASHLLDRLAVIARREGIERFEAEVLAENQPMMEVFQHSGFELGRRLQYGTYHVTLPIKATAEAEEKAYGREKIAAAASLRYFFSPRSVAVVGASREPGTIGGEIFRNLLRRNFAGVVYPVNHRASAVAGVRAYPSVGDIPDDVELAVIAVPADRVLEVAEQCGQKGVRGLVVISAGFKEAGQEGAARETALLARCRGYGMRLIGPNCMGVLNTDPAVSFDATFSPAFPPRGNIGLSTQSGALGLALLDYARELNIGLSTFVSVGNKADVSGNDLLQYWEEDPQTEVVLLYLESFGNPRKFVRLARSVAAKKPIVAVKSGRTAAGSRAAASHTGALASFDVATEGLFQQSGVIRTDTLEELFDVASLLAHQPLPNGRKVAILTNSGGPAILAADVCESHGLHVPPPGEATLTALREFLPPAAGLVNPIDLLAAATADDYARALRIFFQDDAYDSILVIFTPPLVTQPEAVARAIAEAAEEFDGRKTLLTCFMSARGAPPDLATGKGRFIPSFAFPESAALAVSKVCDYAEWRKRPAGSIPELAGIDRVKARRIIDETTPVGRGSFWLPAEASAELLQAYGIRAAKVRFTATRRGAIQVAKEIGYPVALKLASSTISHKTDVGGVILNLQSDAAVRRAFDTVESCLAQLGRREEMQGVVVQEMVNVGVEIITGVTQDPSFGPLIMFGLGGVYVELLKDAVFRIHPLTDVDALEMIHSSKASTLLSGWRGSPPADIAALQSLLLRVSALVEDLPELMEMDLNPVKVLPADQGCVVVDARILIRRSG